MISIATKELSENKSLISIFDFDNLRVLNIMRNDEMHEFSCACFSKKSGRPLRKPISSFSVDEQDDMLYRSFKHLFCDVDSSIEMGHSNCVKTLISKIDMNRIIFLNHKAIMASYTNKYEMLFKKGKGNLGNQVILYNPAISLFFNSLLSIADPDYERIESDFMHSISPEKVKEHIKKNLYPKYH